MRSKPEQIQAILSNRPGHWARSLLAPGAQMADVQYTDFISVTPDEVVAHVLTHGFDPRGVWTPNDPPGQRDDKHALEPKGAQWITSFTERGSRFDEHTFDRYEDAVRYLVLRLVRSAWTLLNHAYWHRHHPELKRLPEFGTPWPSGS
ncbi:hypothetical protein [Chondromyces crocatus]|uniref:Uncharacterized protein n=1 Tax=Chondromyces crocatus TaxID=52 RepID=A0A0K1EBB2_CHOCO|nr:hypothetical protein [Chondromyces crocatus]AKT38171.1 uncharacterized protein CMC5_023140 [Chondromyces crocatus]